MLPRIKIVFLTMAQLIMLHSMAQLMIMLHSMAQLMIMLYGMAQLIIIWHGTPNDYVT